MYQRILVPLDGSELAERVLSYVEGMARRHNSEVILLTACVPGEPFERPLRAYLKERAQELQSLGIKVSPLVIQGDVASEILDFAEKGNIGLIAISTHGRGGTGIWPLGSIANKVAQTSRIPILLIRSSEPEAVLTEKKLQKILIPLDGSHFAENTIPYVEGLVEGMNSDIVLLRVIEPIKISSWAAYGEGFSPEEYEKQFMDRAEREAKHYLSEKEDALRNKGLEVRSATLLGKPAEAILQYAEDNSVGLIALATHGFSGIAKWAYGSVASKITEGSPKPLLLIRPLLPTL